VNWRRETKQRRRIPTVVLVGGDTVVQEGCRRAAAVAAAARLEVAGVKEVHTLAATWRPFALVVSEEVYDFDPMEFEALAQDVGAALLLVSAHTTSVEKVQQELTSALSEAFLEQTQGDD
jgi:hypothetical protein